MYSKETNPAGGPITVEDVQNARLIAWPLTLLHCCLVTDYGGEVSVSSQPGQGTTVTVRLPVGAAEAVGSRQ